MKSSPFLNHFEPDWPTFINKYWSSEGRGWIMMQPDTDKEFQQASTVLKETVTCLFDFSPHGTWPQNISFGSCFIGETTCGQCRIRQYSPHIWGIHFLCICDCSSMKEVLYYKGKIPMVCCWAKEFLGYHFTIVNRSNKIMFHIDTLTRRFGNLIIRHIEITSLISSHNCAKFPCAYAATKFSNLGKVKITETENPSRDRPPSLTSDVLHQFSQDITTP